MTMTRDQICVERNLWNQAGAGTTPYWGETVWSAIGSRHWLQTDLRSVHLAGVTSRPIHRHAICEVKTGTYIHRDSSAITFPGSSWNALTTSDGYRTRHHETWDPARVLSLTIPAETAKLYTSFYPRSNGGTATLALSSGTLVKSSINTHSTTGDFLPAANYSQSQWGPVWVLIATDCGGGTLTITPDSTSPLSLIGFVCVGSEDSTPDVGVFDPGTRIDIMASGQPSPGPIGLAIGAGTSFHWGEAHWYATSGQVLGSPAETFTLDNVAWSPAADTWVREVGESYRSSLTGTISVAASGDGTNVGTYARDTILAPSGCQVLQSYAWNAAAASIGLVLAVDGGFCGQLGHTDDWSRGRPAGTLAWTSITGPWATNTEYIRSLAEGIEMRYGNWVARTRAGNSVMSADSMVVAYSASDIVKAYKAWANTAGVAAADGDVWTAWCVRDVLPAVGTVQYINPRNMAIFP